MNKQLNLFLVMVALFQCHTTFSAQADNPAFVELADQKAVHRPPSIFEERNRKRAQIQAANEAARQIRWAEKKPTAMRKLTY
jgi:hypothetical protein